MGISLLVCDDHEIIRSGVASMLADTDIEIVGEAADGKESVKQAIKLKPDVVLLDIRMPEGDGLEVLENIKAKVPTTKVVMFSTHDSPTYIARAIAWGAMGYVLKGSSRDDMIATIRAAAVSESTCCLGEMHRVAGLMKVRQTIDDDDVPLTARETQVLRHIALGLSNKEIALSLEISIETVKEHVQNILRKIAVSHRTHAAVWAVRKGLV